MKMKKFKASALCLAFGASVVAASVAQGGTLTLERNGKVPCFATHIFGDGTNGADSSGQQVFAPDLEYTVVDNAGALMAAAAGTVEFRFNLGNGAVFTDVITDDHFSLSTSDGAGGTAVLTNFDVDNLIANVTPGVLFTVVSGGQVGDFDVTVRLDQAVRAESAAANVAMLVGDVITLHLATGAFTAATVQDATTNVQYNNVMYLGTAGSTVEASISIQNGEDPTPQVTIATSADPLVLQGDGSEAATAAALTGTALTAGDGLNTINMSDADILFSMGTDGTVDGEIDGSDSLNPGQNENAIGSYRLVVTESTQTWADTAGIATSTQVSDPAGDVYAPDGADTITMSIVPSVTSGFTPFNSTGAINMIEGQCNGAGTTTAATTISADAVSFDISSHARPTVQTICVSADGVNSIQPQTFTATVTYDNFEPTYRDDSYEITLGPWVRNGCTATFFNVTSNNSSGDETYMRITNATESPAPVRVRVWGQDGTLLGENGALLTNALGAHETQVFTPEEIQTAVGTTEWTGRARVVAFVGANSCVGQNLVRSSGVNTNMTGTTDANDGSYVDYVGAGTYGSSNSGN